MRFHFDGHLTDPPPDEKGGSSAGWGWTHGHVLELTRMIGFDTDGRHASLDAGNCSLVLLPFVVSHIPISDYLSISCTFHVGRVY